MPQPLKHMVYSAGIIPDLRSNTPCNGSNRKEIIIHGMVIDTVVEVLEGGSGWETLGDAGRRALERYSFPAKGGKCLRK